MTYPFAASVQWVHRTKTGGGSSYVGTTWTESAAVATSAVFAPGGSTETRTGGDQVITQPTLYGVDPTLGVTAEDKFLVAGVAFEVDGDPANGWQSPFTGWAPGQVVRLKKVNG